jgi:hypothetical protein
VRIQLEGTNYLHMREVHVWAPATATHRNLAIGTAASHSSTAASHAGAVQAVDGLVDGNYNHTNLDSLAWWQTDLGSVQNISTVSVFKRASCCPERLANFYVFVSEQPFASTDLTTTLAQSGVAAYYYATVAGQFEVPVGRPGRYVRIQLSGTNYLHLAEVQVWGDRPELRPLSRSPESPPDR